MPTKTVLHPYFHAVILPVRRKLQRWNYDCGPASLEIVLETLGKHVSEQTLIKIAKTNPHDGTTPERLAHALKKLHVPHRVIPRGTIKLIEENVRNGNLCIVDYQAWGEGHWSVIFGFNRDHFFIADPYKRRTTKHPKTWGFRTERKTLFAKRWHDRFPNGEKDFHWMVAVPVFGTSH